MFLNITKQELETPRSANEMLLWVNNRIDEIGKTLEGKKALRIERGKGNGYIKKLVEEALPIAIFAKYHFKESFEVQVKHVIGKKGYPQYDAEVIDMRKDKSPIKYLEITQAHGGVSEHLRMMKLERDGHVPALGNFWKSSTKETMKSVDVENRIKYQYPDDILGEELSRIARAADKKYGKANPYPDGTALLIAFEDRLAIRSFEDVSALDHMVKIDLLSKLTSFQWLALVGWSNQCYLEYDLKRDNFVKNEISHG
jgi:hypothetical protein